jgi:hypothetical protein
MSKTVDPWSSGAFADLANAAEETKPSDRLLAESLAKVQRMSTALRRLSEELAVERRRTRELQGELERLRAP